MDESLRRAAEIRQQLSDRPHSDSTELARDDASTIRLSRLNIYLFDFHEALDFASYILHRNFYKVKNPRALKIVHSAFDTSLIISYSRPFHKSNEQGDRRRVSLKLDALAHALEPEEITLHDRIMAKRDQAFAHSDAIAHELEGLDYSGGKAMFYKNARDCLAKAEVEMLRGMIKKWIYRLKDLRTTAKAALKNQKRE